MTDETAAHLADDQPDPLDAPAPESALHTGLVDHEESAFDPDDPAAAPRARVRDRRTTVVAWLTIAAVVLGVGGMFVARTIAYDNRIPGPSADAVSEEFVTAVLAADAGWTDVASPELVARFAETQSLPLSGIPGALTAADITVTGETGNVIAYDRGTTAVEDATIADSARRALHVTYTLADDTTVVVPLVLTLRRTFTGDDPTRPDTASPWRVTEFGASAAADTSATAADVCGTPRQALQEISDTARREATMAVGCAFDTDPTAWVPEDTDPAAWAQVFPVFDAENLPANALQVEAGLAQLPVTVADKRTVALLAQTKTDSGTAGWALLDFVEVAP